MSLFTDFRSYLLFKPQINLRLADRLYPLRAPQGVVRPYLIYSQVSDEQCRSLSGSSGSAETRLQLDLWTDNFNSGWETADALRDALDGYRGTWGFTEIGHCLLDADAHEYSPPVDASDEGAFRFTQQYLIWHAVSVPQL